MLRPRAGAGRGLRRQHPLQESDPRRLDPFAFELAGRKVARPLAHPHAPSRGPAEGPRRNPRRLPPARRPDHCRQSGARGDARRDFPKSITKSAADSTRWPRCSSSPARSVHPSGPWAPPWMRQKKLMQSASQPLPSARGRGEKVKLCASLTIRMSRDPRQLRANRLRRAH
jgi:hypothetical protein